MATAAGSPFAFPEPWTSPGFLLWRASTSWQRSVRHALEPHGLTHLQFVLLAVTWWLESRTHGEAVQTTISELAGSDQNTTSDTLRRLERKGLVHRSPGKNDRRIRIVTLTEQGTALLAAAATAVETVDRQYFADPVTQRLLQALADPALHNDLAGQLTPPL